MKSARNFRNYPVKQDAVDIEEKLYNELKENVSHIERQLGGLIRLFRSSQN